MIGSIRLRSVTGFAAGILALLTIGVIFVPLLSHQDPLSIGDVLATRLLPPGSRDSAGNFHLLGTDRFGRDLFVRMMLAGRVSLAVGILGSLLASAVGTIVGAIGYDNFFLLSGALSVVTIVFLPITIRDRCISIIEFPGM